jgi:hypothetical protein
MKLALIEYAQFWAGALIGGTLMAGFYIFRRR